MVDFYGINLSVDIPFRPIDPLWVWKLKKHPRLGWEKFPPNALLGSTLAFPEVAVRFVFLTKRSRRLSQPTKWVMKGSLFIWICLRGLLTLYHGTHHHVSPPFGKYVFSTTLSKSMFTGSKWLAIARGREWDWNEVTYSDSCSSFLTIYKM